MTEDQKVRYRQMLADKKQGKSIDLDSFVKEVREEKLAQKLKTDQYNQSWLDHLSGSFNLIENVIEHKRKELWQALEVSPTDDYRKLLDEFSAFVTKQYQSIGK